MPERFSMLSLQIHPAALGAAISAALIGVFLLYSLVYLLLIRRDELVRGFTFLEVSLLFYLLGYAVYVSASDIRAVDFWTRVCYMGVALTPLTFRLFAETLMGLRRSWITATIAVVCVFLVLWVWFDGQLLITHELETLLPKDHLTMRKGVWFDFFVGLTYVLILITFARFVYYTLRNREFNRDGWLLTAGFTFWLLGSVYDACVAMGLVQGNAQPWIGPSLMVVAIGAYLGKVLESRGRALERRVAELNSLQVVGRVVSSSLNLDTILMTIYGQVIKLMPAHIFYVAFYNPEINEVSFPLVIEEGRRVQWPARRAASGLTEHILKTKEPVLIPDHFPETLIAMGLRLIGRQAVCWMGVPILAGDEALGVISVQSLTSPRLYDESHQEILMIIAAQAAVVIQNANLYSKTDEALARRVQELDSILRTARDGMLFLDQQFKILAVNRALVGYLGLTRADWVGNYLVDALPGGGTLLRLTGYVAEDLRDDCELLRENSSAVQKAILHLIGPPIRYLERTLVAVRDVEGDIITGWLMIFHDITEERNLAQLRDEFTHMLVHDLRSPMTVVHSSLEIMEYDFRDGHYEELPHLVGLAKKSSDRVLQLIGQLLDINRLEEGQLPLYPEWVDVKVMLEEAANRFQPLIIEAGIEVVVQSVPLLPRVFADPDLLSRAIHNLLDNAIKFSPSGSQVRVWARPDEESSPPAILVGVTDAGPGIPPDMRVRLFKKFQQANSNGARRRGSGLGLSFCKLALEAHGGKIWVESQMGQGSTFIMRLPVEPPTVNDAV